MALQGNGWSALGIQNVALYAADIALSKFFPVRAAADGALLVAATFPPAAGPAVQINSTPAAGAAIPTANNALDTIAMMYGWAIGANQFTRLSSAPNTGVVSMTENSLQTFSISFIYDADSANVGVAGGTSNLTDNYFLSGVGADTVAFNMGYDDTTGQWFRIRSQGNATDGVPTRAEGLLGAAAYLYGYNPLIDQFDRITTEGDDLDAIAVNGTGRLAVVAHNAVFNGTDWDRKRSASAAEQALAVHIGVQASANVGNWTLTDAPAANTAATATRAAGAAGVRHICTSIQASINAVAAIPAPLTLVLRDGAPGVGAILWQDRMTAVLGTTDKISISGLSIVGSAATAMTLEFTGAPGATSFETVSLTGYSVS